VKSARTRRIDLLSRVIVALVALAVVLLPFHAHDVAAAHSGSESVKTVIMLSDGGHDHSDAAPDTVPDGLKSDCVACVIMKQIECPTTHGRSAVIEATESVVYPVAEAERPQRLIAEHFRPPCSARV